MKNQLIKLPRTSDEKALFSKVVLVSDTVKSGLSIKALRVLISVIYLQRGNEEVFPGEVSAMYYELTKDQSWRYETCRQLCNELAKKGWLEKHKLGINVAYTPSEKSIKLFK